MNIVAIIQARTGSTRFANKVFADLAGQPLIWHVVNRLKFSKKINQIILATTVNPKDDALQTWANNENVTCFRGSEDDVLNRFYEAAKLHHADIIIRVTADDPFKDYEIIDNAIEILVNSQFDFVCNCNPPSFPEGLDTEVFSFKTLELAQVNAKSDFEREHVTQFVYKNPSLFKTQNINYSENISSLRWTIDTEQDYQMVKEVYNSLYKEGSIFLTKDILDFLDANPEIAKMNMDVARSEMYK